MDCKDVDKFVTSGIPLYRDSVVDMPCPQKANRCKPCQWPVPQRTAPPKEAAALRRAAGRPSKQALRPAPHGLRAASPPAFELSHYPHHMWAYGVRTAA